MTPDPLWAENLIAGYLGRLLRALSTRGDWQRAIRVVDAAAELIFYLAARLQVDEARLLRRTIISYLHDAPGAHGPDAGRQWLRHRMGDVPAGRRGPSGPDLHALLARPHPAVSSKPTASSWHPAFDEAVATIQSPYKVGAPRQLLEMFERLAYGIGFEQRTEHQRVTPGMVGPPHSSPDALADPDHRDPGILRPGPGRAHHPAGRRHESGRSRGNDSGPRLPGTRPQARRPPARRPSRLSRPSMISDTRQPKTSSGPTRRSRLMSRKPWKSSCTASSGRSPCCSTTIRTTAPSRTCSGRATGCCSTPRSGRS